MSWNYREVDQRDEIAALKQQLSVQGASFAALEDEVLRKSNELTETRTALQETGQKLRSEADRALDLEATLKRRTEELQQEKLDRANSDNAAQSMREELKAQATSARELQTIIDRLSYDADGSTAQRSQLITDKTRLETRVQELEKELRRQQFAPPPPPKPATRPRTSSLSNLKLVSMERDLEQIRTLASSHESELGTVKEKLAKAQRELVHAVNDKLVLEKKVADLERALKDTREEREEKEEELSSLRSHDRCLEREEELTGRIDDMESECELLRSELSKTQNLRGQLQDARNKLKRSEENQAELVREKETALDQLDALEKTLRNGFEEKELKISKLEQIERTLRDELQNERSSAKPPTLPSKEADIARMLSAIERLRTERDSLRRDLEFTQMEARFKIEAFERQLAASNGTQQSTAETESSSSSAQEAGAISADSLELAIRNSERQRVVSTALIITVDHFRCENEELLQTLAIRSAIGANVVAEANKLREQIEQMTTALADTREQRLELEQQMQLLQADLKVVRQELADVEERGNPVRSPRAATPRTDSNREIETLKAEITELSSRVLRRTEQIGHHQHEIKRLETNLQLSEDRIGELSSDLDMLNTQKMAMLEDCNVARDERDDAKTRAVALEMEIEQLSTAAEQATRDVEVLKARLDETEAARTAEIAALVATIAHRDGSLQVVSRELNDAEAKILAAQAQSMDLSKALDDLQTSKTRQLAELQSQIENGCDFAKELEIKSAACDDLKVELGALSHRHDAVTGALRAAEERLALADANRTRLEDDNATMAQRLEIMESELTQRTQELANMREADDEKCTLHSKAMDALNAELKAMKEELQALEVRATRSREELSLQHRITSEDLASTKHELEHQQSLYNDLKRSLDESASTLANEREAMEERLKQTLRELELVKLSLQNETDGRQADQELSEREREGLLSKVEILAANESQLHAKVQAFEVQETELRESLAKQQHQIARLQTDLDNLAPENLRANLKSQALEKQLQSSEKELNAVRQQLALARGSLAESEKSGKTVEMDLLLVKTQQERTISTLRQQLKQHEESGDKVQLMQKTITELKDQVTEMDNLLRSKCEEIEENDDKFIELLKEKKKLANRVDALTKKNTSLQSKLNSVLAPVVVPTPPSLSRQRAAPAVIEIPTVPPIPPIPEQAAPAPTPAVPRPSFTALPTPSKSRDVEDRRIAPSVFSLKAPEVVDTPTMQRGQLPTSSSIGKKRTVPDDFDVPVPPTAFVAHADSENTPESSAPRSRKPLDAIRSGFTPVRGKGTNLRPTLSQPSPIRRSAAYALQSIITDTQNSPPKRMPGTQSKPGRGWLGKLRGGTTNPFAGTTRQNMAEEMR